MSVNRNQLKNRLLEYVRRHREGLTILEIAEYVSKIDGPIQEFQEMFFELIQEGAVFKMGERYTPLEPMEDLPDLQLSERQKERCMQLITSWYEKWRYNMTDDHTPHRLGFALEDLKLLLTCDQAERRDAAQQMEAIRRRSPALAQVIEGSNFPE
jgi:hypothetical protein